MRKLLFGLSLVFGSLAVAAPGNIVFGSGSTGGGFAVSCSQTPLAEESFQLLDTYEVENKFGFDLVEGSGSIEEDYFRSVDRTYTLQGHPHMAEEHRKDIAENLKNIFNHVRFVQEPQELPYVDDVGKTVSLPPRCELVQVALYRDDPQEIIILEPLWNKLSTLDKTALLKHELWGHFYRMMGENTSELSRAVVAHMFAENSGLPILDGLSSDAESFMGDGPSFSYYSVSSHFYVYTPEGYAHKRIQFTHFFGRAALAKTYIDLPELEWKLKAVYSQNGDRTCVYDVPGVDLKGAAGVRGTIAQGSVIEYRIKTGEPIELRLIRNGQTVSTNEVFSCQ